MQAKVSDAVDFILKNRRKGAFKGWNRNEIALAIAQAIQDNSFGWISNEKGEIQAVVLCTINHKEKIVFVTNILSIIPSALKMFFELYESLYDGYDIQGLRNGKIVKYNTQKLKSIYGKRPSCTCTN